MSSLPTTGQEVIMKIVSVIIAAVLILASSAIGGDYIRLGIDSIPAGATNYEIRFYVERTCPSPTLIMGASNGFVLAPTGDVTWAFNHYVADSVASSWFSLGGLLFTSGFDGSPPDWFLTGGAAMCCGMPITLERSYFSIFLDLGPGIGQILIDSSFVGTAGAWKFSGMTCGLGGAPDRPLFLNRDYDDVHPAVITVYEPLCGDANLSGAVDIDDPVYLVNYVFLFGPAPNPILKSDCDCSGGDVPVDIDDIVHLMDYILRGGPAPCDTDGDGVLDC